MIVEQCTHGVLWMLSLPAGSPALSTNASTTKAGTYPIDAGQGTLVASNYQLSFANGTLTVMQ